ncbi:hypothetical protein DFH07DRAFT_887339 [Mycena maculata]|uniref:Uncharacterized protein n=1 Tax=Mycena maculata TaxID=230809 RepID=A0AAD7N9T1_9AGAR|nr:hypothetical protein DFH07DRAFT_887339 [Mycena maculata]
MHQWETLRSSTNFTPFYVYVYVYTFRINDLHDLGLNEPSCTLCTQLKPTHDDSSLSRPPPRPRGLQRHCLPHLRPRPLRRPGQHLQRRRLRRPRRLPVVRPALLDKVRVLDALPRATIPPSLLWPIAKLLDHGWRAGRGEGGTYKKLKAELKRFLQIHRTGEEPLCAEEITILSHSGVRELGNKGTESIVTPMKVHLSFFSFPFFSFRFMFPHTVSSYFIHFRVKCHN